MRLIATSIVLSALLLLSAFAEDTGKTEQSLQQVVARLAVPAVLRGKFTQSRSIKEISRPLVSNGSFVLSDKGLYWKQEKPIIRMMIADGERLIDQIGDGPLQIIDAEKQPLVLPFSRIFLSIFRGNEAELRSNFDIEYRNQGDGWEIELAPTSYPMSEAIDTINLGGREYIEELTVTTRSSEQTMIKFSDLRTDPNQLTEYEIELYAR